MSALVYKEFIIQKRYLLINFAYIILAFILFSLTGAFAGSVYYLGSVATTFMFVQMGCTIDEKNHSEIVLNSLPLRRIDLVRAKYQAAFLHAVLMLGIMAVTGFFVSQIPQISIGLIQGRDVVNALITVLLLTAVYYPFFFKYGYIRAKGLTLLLFYPFFFGPSLVLSYAAANPEKPIVQSAQAFFSRSPAWQVGLIAMGAAGIFLLLSLSVSGRLYQQREFK